MGEIGIDRHEFLYELKLWEINAIVRGYRRRAHTQWESVRWQTFLILCALGAKSIHHPDDIQKFTWEVEDEDDGDEVTEEDVRAMQREMAAINEQLAKRYEKDNADHSALH